jgi:hypothetical protein
MWPVWWFDLMRGGLFRDGEWRTRLPHRPITKTPPEPFGKDLRGYAEQLTARCDRRLFAASEGV